MSVRAFAPASIGNFAAGFDVLGAAIAPCDGSLWGDIVEIEPSDGTAPVELQVEGPYASALPLNPDHNLAVASYKLLAPKVAERGRRIEPIRMILHKGLPLYSGLGSSASSVVASLVALNAYWGEPFEKVDLLALAGMVEGSVSGAIHYDNVAPSLLGGIQLVTGGIIEPNDECPRALSERIPFFESWCLAVVHPDLSVPTEMARRILPESIPLKRATVYWGNLAAFVHALHVRDESLAGATLRDVLIEPHRQNLVPGFIAVKRGAFDQGALGCSLSGSGPSVFAVANSLAKGQAVLDEMCRQFEFLGQRCDARLCRVDGAGARVL